MYNLGMGIYAIKPKFQKTLKPLENLFVRYKIHPTAVNLLEMLMSIIGALCIYISPEHGWTLIVMAIAVNMRTACNALDGLVARRLNVASRFGEVLNELIDRLNDTILFVAIYFLPSTNDNLALFTIVLILINSYLSILSKAAGGTRQYGGPVGKADRMIYMSITGVLIFLTGNQEIWNYFLWFILIATFFTFMQRFTNTKHELSK